jgi:hypothetical protein
MRNQQWEIRAHLPFGFLKRDIHLAIAMAPFPNRYRREITWYLSAAKRSCPYKHLEGQLNRLFSLRPQRYSCVPSAVVVDQGSALQVKRPCTWYLPLLLYSW